MTRLKILRGKPLQQEIEPDSYKTMTRNDTNM